MGAPLQGKRIAILATDGFEQSELTDPRDAFRQAGADTTIVSLESGEIKAWKHTNWGDSIQVDLVVSMANAADFDALLLPGGVMNPDKLRMDPDAVNFVKAFAQAGKPIAAICHGPWLLVEADLARGATLTSWPSLKTDITNAGGTWVDQPVVVSKNMITSRKPDDIPAFSERAIDLFATTAPREVATSKR